MLGIKQIAQNKTAIDSSKFPALFLGPGKYAQAASNSTLNNFTAFTVAHSMNYTNLFLSGGQQYNEFSILRNNSSNIFLGSTNAGAVIQQYGTNSSLVLICTGSSKSIEVKDDANIHGPGGYTRSQGHIVTKVLTGDASSNTYALHTIHSGGFSPASENFTVHTKATGSFTFTNWGTFDTDGFVSVGAYRESGEDQVTSDANLTSSHGFLRGQVWNSVLTDEQILNTVGGDGTVFSMPSYTEGSYPQPLHEWIPVMGENFEIPDTGSSGSGPPSIPLTIHGLAKVGYYPARV